MTPTPIPSNPATGPDGDSSRREILGRVTALVAGPLLLGRQALGLTLRDARNASQDAPPDPAPRLAITPPSNSVKRRG